MPQLFNEGFGKQPRINYERMPFIGSVPNTFPVQALRQDSQTCSSATMLKVHIF